MPISGLGSPNQPFIPEDKGVSNSSTLPEQYKQEVYEYLGLLSASITGEATPEMLQRLAELKSKIEETPVPDNVKEVFEALEKAIEQISYVGKDITDISRQLQDPTLSPEEQALLESRMLSDQIKLQQYTNDYEVAANKFENL